MTRFYRIKRRVDDLKLGDMFIGWANRPGGTDQKPRRILDIKEKHTYRTIVLDDGSKYTLHPEHLTIVQERA